MAVPAVRGEVSSGRASPSQLPHGTNWAYNMAKYISIAYSRAPVRECSPMQTVNVASFKSQLSQLLAQVELGEEIQVCKRNVPIARVVPDAPKRTANRTVLGCGAGTVVVRGDLTEPALDESEWEMLRAAPSRSCLTPVA